MGTKFYIWSIEHDAWWAPDSLGYTREIELAGTYDRTTAHQIVTRANVRAFHECMIPVACVERQIVEAPHVER